MTLSLTVFYDIPQLNLGLHLHQHMDIHLRDDEFGNTGPTVMSSSSDNEINNSHDTTGAGLLKRNFSFLHFGRRNKSRNKNLPEQVHKKTRKDFEGASSSQDETSRMLPDLNLTSGDDTILD